MPSEYQKNFKDMILDILTEAQAAGYDTATPEHRDAFAEFLISKGVCLCHVDLAQEYADGALRVTFPIKTPACQVSAHSTIEGYKYQNAAEECRDCLYQDTCGDYGTGCNDYNYGSEGRTDNEGK